MSDGKVNPVKPRDQEHPWRAHSEDKQQPEDTRSLDDLFGYYADPNIPIQAREGLIRSIMQVVKLDANSSQERVLRRQVVRFLTDIGNEVAPVAEGNPQLRRAARVTLVRHLMPLIRLDEYFDTVHEVVNFYHQGECGRIPSYVSELSAQDRKRWESGFKAIATALHNRCIDVNHGSGETDHVMQQLCELLMSTRSWELLADIRMPVAIPLLYKELASRRLGLEDEFRRELSWRGWKKIYENTRNGLEHELKSSMRVADEIRDDLVTMLALCGSGRDFLSVSDDSVSVDDETVGGMKRALLHILAPFVRALRQHWRFLPLFNPPNKDGVEDDPFNPPAHKVICDRLKEIADEHARNEGGDVIFFLRREASSLVRVLTCIPIPQADRLDVLNCVHALPAVCLPSDVEDIFGEIAGGDLFDGLPNADVQRPEKQERKTTVYYRQVAHTNVLYWMIDTDLAGTRVPLVANDDGTFNTLDTPDRLLRHLRMLTDVLIARANGDYVVPPKKQRPENLAETHEQATVRGLGWHRASPHWGAVCFSPDINMDFHMTAVSDEIGRVSEGGFRD